MKWLERYGLLARSKRSIMLLRFFDDASAWQHDDDDTGTSFNISHFHHKKRLQKECSKLHGSWTPKTSRVTLRLLISKHKKMFLEGSDSKKASSDRRSSKKTIWHPPRDWLLGNCMHMPFLWPLRFFFNGLLTDWWQMQAVKSSHYLSQKCPIKCKLAAMYARAQW